MILKIHSIFPAHINEIFKKLQEVKTLQYISSPYASFVSENPENKIWNVGKVKSFKLKIFGIISMGTHTIKVIKFSKNEILTNECNKCVKVWNHKITLKKLNGSKTAYTDEIELKAGNYTPFVYLWAILFYKHRQKKWKNLLKHSENSLF
ncbi:hypothetical protein [Methanobrevibacter curvatus]|uniref:Polyketide cyclase / dehydrase and lipid transport n=1 Tax=Methanobrevibacter curvatus TaxID=49547 RepID=A0A166AIH0_9EURY|nr:hypothetical protein [Methanobrevibacter curvatus]KZX12074.1 hypothetical protein MBCUR_11770 [Methanobrevibacter curvatus]